MLFQYVSDIHLEYITYIPYIKKTADNLFLVGDIGHPGTALFNKFLKICSEKYKNVFIVYGNHEYYSIIRGRNKKIETMREKLEYAKDFPSNVHLLDNSCIYFNKNDNTVSYSLSGISNKNNFIKIIGSTLWSDNCTQSNNFKNIFIEKDIPLTYDYQAKLFNKSKHYLINELYKEDIDSIILTHYSTHKLSNGSYLDFKDSNHIMELFLNSKLIACINGHTHSSVNLVAPGTTIKLLSNCFGYKNENQDIVKYNPNAVLDLNQNTLLSFSGLYSKSEFNPIKILYTVMNRPNPIYDIGNLDETTAFSISNIGKDNPIIYVNSAFEKLTGYSLSEIRGKNCRFLQSPSGHVVRGSNREHCDNEFLHKIKGEIYKQEECQFIIYNFTKSGEKFINLVTVIPLQINGINYLVGFQCDISSSIHKFKFEQMDTSIIDTNIIKDLTSNNINISDELTETNSISFSLAMSDSFVTEKLSNESIRYKHFFDNNPMFLCILNNDGKFKKCNDTVFNVLGYCKNEIYNRLLLDFTYSEDVGIILQHFDILKIKKETLFSHRIVKKDSSCINVSWTLKLKGNTIYCTGIYDSNELQTTAMAR